MTKKSLLAAAVLFPASALAQSAGSAVTPGPSAPSAVPAPPTASVPAATQPAPKAYPYPYPPGVYPPGASSPGPYPPGYSPPPGYAPPGYAPPGYAPPGYAPPGYAPPQPPAPEFRIEKRWYGWQTLLADGASLSLAIGSSSINGGSSTLSGLGLLGFLFASPIVHWGHGHTGKGFASMGIRVGMPMLGMALLLAGDEDLFNGDGEDSASSGEKAFSVLGILTILAWIPTSVAVDAAALAREEVKVPAVSLVPLIQPRQGGATLGLGGTF